MAKYSFSDEAIENYEQKLLCVFVLDVSGVMQGEPINELNECLRKFLCTIKEDIFASERTEISILAFNDCVKLVQEPSLVDNISIPHFSCSGSCDFISAIYEAINLVAVRKQWYKSINQPYYRPWIILLTNGQSARLQDVADLAQHIRQDVSDKKYSFLPVSVDGKNINILKLIEKGTPVTLLKDFDYNSLCCVEIEIDETNQDGLPNNKEWPEPWNGPDWI